jgi:hypothetical protein
VATLARIVLSHSSRDNASASALKAWLDGQGFAAAFLDFDTTCGIPPGAHWKRTLYRALQLCQALVILQTPHWSASRWCFAEFAQVRALGMPIVQVVDDDAGAAEPPIAAGLGRSWDFCWIERGRCSAPVQIAPFSAGRCKNKIVRDAYTAIDLSSIATDIGPDVVAQASRRGRQQRTSVCTGCCCSPGAMVTVHGGGSSPGPRRP